MLKKILRYAAILIAAAIIVIQFFQIDRSDPPVDGGQTLNAAIEVPADVSQILARSCNDCHSNTTIYPWYSYIQPVGWFLKGHIDDGRRHFNVSEFNGYDAKKKVKKLEEVCEVVESKEMPLPSYLLIHRDAVLSDSDITTLCDWSRSGVAQIGGKK